MNKDYFEGINAHQHKELTRKPKYELYSETIRCDEVIAELKALDAARSKTYPMIHYSMEPLRDNIRDIYYQLDALILETIRGLLLHYLLSYQHETNFIKGKYKLCTEWLRHNNYNIEVTLAASIVTALENHNKQVN